MPKCGTAAERMGKDRIETIGRLLSIKCRNHEHVVAL